MIEIFYNKIKDLDETIVDNEFLLKRIKDTNDENYKMLRINDYSFLLNVLKEKGIKPEFNLTRYGKLYLKENPIYFNISHTKNAYAIAVASQEVGIDIEIKRKYNEMSLKKMIDKCIAKEEVVLNGNDFIKNWTVKESFLKLLGTGINTSLKDLKVLDKVYLNEESANYKTFDFEENIISISYKEKDEIKIYDLK